MAIATTLAKPCAASQTRPARPGPCSAATQSASYVFAIHAEAEARDRHADLRRRDVAILAARIAQHAPAPAAPGDAARRARVDRRPRRPDDRELGRHEDRIEQDEQAMMSR